MPLHLHMDLFFNAGFGADRKEHMMKKYTPFRKKILAMLIAIILMIPAFTYASGGSKPCLDIITSYYGITDDGRITLEFYIMPYLGEGEDAVTDAGSIICEISGDNGLSPSVTTYEAKSISETCAVDCIYRAPEGRVQGEPAPDPHIYIKATSENCGTLEYTATFDVNTMVRSVILRSGTVTFVDEKGANRQYKPEWEGAMINSRDIMANEIYGKQTVYNGNAFESEALLLSTENNFGFRDAITSMVNLGQDDNDITYLYITSHGCLDMPYIAIYNPGSEDERVTSNYNCIASYKEILSCVSESKLKGRCVIIFDNCFSGLAIDAAEEISLDKKRFTVITSTDSMSYDTTAGEYSSDYFLVGSTELTNMFRELQKLDEPIVTGSIFAEHIDSMINDHSFRNAFFFALTATFSRDRAKALSEYKETKFIPQIWGNLDTPVVFPDPSYDDGHRQLVLKKEEKVIGTDENDAIVFGHYEQDNDLSNGKEPIEWILLDTEPDGTAVLISKFALDVQRYHVERTDSTWEMCSLREWLNDYFYHEAFNADEQQQILTTHVINEQNPDHGTNGGNDTYDKVYLLSLNEVTNKYSNGFWYSYFYDDSMRLCLPTQYAVTRGIGRPGLYLSGHTEGGYWWLRSSGYDASMAASVEWNGNASSFGTYVDDIVVGVRPVIRIPGSCINMNSK